MLEREKKLLLYYGIIISALSVAVFGYFTHPLIYDKNPSFPIYLFILPLLIIWIVAVVYFYYWIQILKETFFDKQNPAKFWAFYIFGIVVGILTLIYMIIDKSLETLENASLIFSVLILIGTLFHCIYWLAIYYEKI